jgi:hypothetical protein
MFRAKTALAVVALAGVAVSLAGPAHATLQIAISVGATSFSCADNGACDSDPAIGTLTLSNMTINGVVFSGFTFTSFGTPANFAFGSGGLQSFKDYQPINNSINNTTNANQAIAITLGDTNFLSTLPSSSTVAVFFTQASGTFQSMPPLGGSVIGVRFFEDPANAQGASTVTDTPGNLIANLSATDTGFFHVNQGILLSESAPLSMTETASIFLAPNTQLLNYDQSFFANTPEPSTWAMMLLGFAGLGLVFVSRGAAFQIRNMLANLIPPLETQREF